jgi:hypothetical protein
MRLRKFIRKFHRWIGILASLWLLLLASTGLLLQHSQDWHLDKSYINSPLLLKTYGIGQQFIAFEDNNHQLLQIDKQLIQDGQTTIKLQQEIKSAIHYQSNWVVLTNTQILWINPVGQIIQSLDALDGLDFPIKNIGTNKNTIVAKSKQNLINLQTLQPIQVNNIIWSQPIHRQSLKQQAIQQSSHNFLSLEQFIFDIHAGITTASIFNDFAAIALILLSLSGIFLFFKKRKTNRQAR